MQTIKKIEKDIQKYGQKESRAESWWTDSSCHLTNKKDNELEDLGGDNWEGKKQNERH